MNTGDERGRRSTRIDPVGLFFGPTASGPFALLDLPASSADPHIVLEALHRRLAQLASHPQAATPAAEEVSLALHAAAAQLCDPAIQRVLLRTWGGEASDAEPAANLEMGYPVDEPSEIVRDESIERDIHVAVGLSGGWNAQALSRFAMACDARGIEPAAALRTLDSIGRKPARVPGAKVFGARGRSRGPGTPRATAPARVDVPAAFAEAEGRSPRAIPRDAIILAVLGVLGIGLLTAAVILLTPAQRPALPSESLTPGAIASEPLTIPGRQVPPTPEAASHGELESGDPRAVTLEIVGATRDLLSDPAQAHARFVAAHSAFGRTWPLMTADEITSVVSGIVDYCYAASRFELATAGAIVRPLRESFAPTKGGVRSAAAAAAIAGRLLQEKELPRAFLDAIESGAFVGPQGGKVERSASFRSGLELNMGGLALAIADMSPASAEAWVGFVEVRDAAFAGRQPASDAATIGALDLVLGRAAGGATATGGHELQKPVPPRELVGSVGVLSRALRWQPVDELRNALSGWLEDASVPGELIAEITRAMVASSAPGVDSTMILAANAGPEARSALRERIAQAWQGKPTTGNREDAEAWARWAEPLLAETPSSESECLLIASRMSEATRAADALRAGKSDVATGIMSQARSSVSVGPKSPVAVVPFADPRSKALEYAAAGSSVQARLEVLKQIQGSGEPPDRLLGNILITEASRGTPAAIRDLAREEVRRHAHTATIVLAALNNFGSIPETVENAEWVAEVAGTGDRWRRKPKWKGEALRALLDRACELFPVSPSEAAIGEAARALADAWWARADGVEQSSDVRPERPSNPGAAIEALEVSLSVAARKGRTAPAALAPADIRKRMLARLGIASGSIEASVARQSACVEWTALIVAHERPADIAAIDAILRQWDSIRRLAATSTEQLLEGERAILRLQMLRLVRRPQS